MKSLIPILLCVSLFIPSLLFSNSLNQKTFITLPSFSPTSMRYAVSDTKVALLDFSRSKKAPFDLHLMVKEHTFRTGSIVQKSLPFFKNTHTIQAKYLPNGHLIVSAINDKQQLKIATFDTLLHPLHTYISFEKYISLATLITHNNNSVSLVGIQSALGTKKSYFNRGISDKRYSILKFNTFLRPSKAQYIDAIKMGDIIKVLYDRSTKNYTLLTQTNDNATIYTYSPYTQRVQNYDLNTSLRFTNMTTHHNTLLLSSTKGAFTFLNKVLTPYKPRLFANKALTYLHVLHNETLLSIENKPSKAGIRHAFVTLYTPKGTILWENSLQIPFNNSFSHVAFTLTHPFVLIGSYHQSQTAAYDFVVFLNKKGLTTAPLLLKTAAENFASSIQKQCIANKIPAKITAKSMQTSIILTPTTCKKTNQFWALFFDTLKNTHAKSSLQLIQFLPIKNISHFKANTPPFSLFTQLYIQPLSSYQKDWVQSIIKLPKFVKQWPIANRFTYAQQQAKLNQIVLKWK